MKFMNTATKTSFNTAKSNNNNNVKEEKREKVSVKLDEHITLPITQGSALITSKELAKHINGVFKGIFTDYCGCNLTQSQFTVELELTLFFNETANNTAALTNAIERAIKPSGSIAQNLQMITANNRSKMYQFANGGKDVLENFVSNTYKNNKGKVNWGQLVTEQLDSGSRYQYLVVQGLDLNKILKFICGNKNKDGHKLEYKVSVIRSVNDQLQLNAMYGMYRPGVINYLLSVMMLDCDEVNKMVSSLGMIPNEGQIPMIRA